MEAGAAHDEDGGKEPDGHGQRHEAERLGVDGGDDDKCHQVVDDDDHEQERAQAIGKARPHER